MRKYRAVSFDAGGTLLEPWPSVGHVYAAVAQEHGLGAFTPEQLNGRFAAAWGRMNEFDYSPRAWAALVVDTFAGSEDRFGLGTPLFQALYSRFSEPEVWHVYDDVRPTLAQLRALDINLAIISNWDDRLVPLLTRLRLVPAFDVIQVSCDCGCQKPDAKIFQAAVAALQLKPEEVLHVGDSESADLIGAQQAGLGAVLLRRGKPSGNASQISSLTEVVSRYDWSLAAERG